MALLSSAKFIQGSLTVLRPSTEFHWCGKSVTAKFFSHQGNPHFTRGCHGRRSTGRESKRMNVKATAQREPAAAFLLAGLVLVALVLRFWQLGEWNFQATEMFTLRDSITS